MIPKQGALYRCFSIAEGQEGVKYELKRLPSSREYLQRRRDRDIRQHLTEEGRRYE